MHKLRTYLISGLLVWLPLWVTYVVIRFVVDLMDTTLALIPRAYRPENLFEIHIPGLGIILAFFLLLITGILVKNIFGTWIVSAWERFIERIPLVRSIYKSVKQITHTVFVSSGSDAFKKVYLVEYPRRDCWNVAFQTNHAPASLANAIGDKDSVVLYVPTTPNPTSGFVVIVPKADAIELDISVDDALKMVISLGVVLPDDLNSKKGS